VSQYFTAGVGDVHLYIYLFIT